MTEYLYIIQFCLLAFSLGLAGLASTKILPLPAYGRFFFGLGLTPFFVSLLLLTASLFAPGTHLLTFLLLPGIAGILLLMLFYKQAYALDFLIPSPPQLRQPLSIILWVTFSLLCAMIFWRICFYSLQPIGNSDAMQYLAEAQHFMLHRDFFQISGMAGTSDGSLRGDPHGSLWITLLASIMPESKTSYTLLRLPSLITFFGFFAAITAFGSISKNRYFAFIAILICCSIPGLWGTLVHSNRDLFRLSGVLLLCAFVVAHTHKKRVPIAALILATALGAFSVQGHGLSLLLVPLITLCWAAVAIANHTPWLKVIMLTLALGFGFAIGGAHIIDSYAQTGSLSGDNVTDERQVKGTYYEEAVHVRDIARMGSGKNILPRLHMTITRDYGWPSLAALFTLLLSGVLLLRKKNIFSKDWRLVLLSVWFIVDTLFIIGVFDVGGMRFGARTALNSRYAMQWYLFAALLAAWGICKLLKMHLKYKTHIKFITVTFVCITAIITVANWPLYPTPAYKNVSDKLNNIMSSAHINCRVLSEDTGLNFYSDRPVVQLYSKPQNDLLHAKDAKQLDILLKQRQLCAVILYNGFYVDLAGDNTPLMQLLKSPAFLVQDANPWRIYVRNSSY